MGAYLARSVFDEPYNDSAVKNIVVMIRFETVPQSADMLPAV